MGSSSDTIFALASGHGKAGVAVIRVSGPDSQTAVQALGARVPEVRRSSLQKIRNAAGEVLDEVVILFFEKGASFTGEDVVELHTHGSIAVVSSVLGGLSDVSGLRLAEPGEFTRRALENDRLDLAQVEGLADLVEAETEAQRKQAFRVLSGAVGDRVEDWRVALIRAAALMEATIDFADEEVPEDVSPEVLDILNMVQDSITGELAGLSAAERIREGFEVAIVGKPNVGKSTLLNRLAGRDAAITSEIAGTTRDVIEVRMDLKGLPVTVLDTAGLRETDDHVEGLGVALAKRRAEQADIRVFLLEEEGDVPDLEPADHDLVYLGKGDLRLDGLNTLSGKTGAGVDQLVDRLTEFLQKQAAGAATMTRQRHRRAMEVALTNLASAMDRIQMQDANVELAAEDIRVAIRALDSLIGRVDVENILDEIFSSFCLGK